jgi:peptidyl-prolyl cis-trans isomerase SurA
MHNDPFVLGRKGESVSMKHVRSRWLGAVAVALVLAGGLARAEVIDEIVAKVNDDIVTKSDLDAEEQGLLQELYRRFSGTDLDARVSQAKRDLLRHLIDRRILIQRAAHIFDMTKMKEFYLESFKNQQDIKSDKELEKLLAQQGMTMSDLKTRLVEDLAPQQVVRAEVTERIAVSVQDERAYYDAHAAEFTVPAQATVREIVVKATDADRAAKRAEAEAIRARVAAPGADFAAVATEVSDAGTKKDGGLLGTVKRGDLAAALDQIAFTLPVGEVSPVMEADYGFHILKVDARTDDVLKPFPDVQAEIETKLQSQRFDAAYGDYMKKAWSDATIWVSPKYQNRLSAADTSN